MLTTTATFDKYRIRPNAKAKLLMTITGESPSRTFYLADDRIHLTTSGEKFEGLVTDWGTIKHTIDLFSKKSNVGNIKIKLNNAPYARDDSGDLSISDDIYSSKITNRLAKIYLWFEGIAQLSDCLQIFEGLVQPIEDATPESVTIPLIDSTFKRHLIIPPNVVNTTDWPDAPPESIGLLLPLHYGAFTINKDDGAPVDGAMAECIWVTPGKVVVSDHVMNSVSAVWIYDPDLDELVKLDSGEYTVTLDDSGKTTIMIDNIIDPLLTAWIYAEMADVEHIDDPDYIFEDDDKKWLSDKDNVTYAEATVDSYTPNGESDEEHEDSIYCRFKNVGAIGAHQNVYLSLRFDANFNTALHHGNDFSFWKDDTSAEIGHLPVTPGDSSLPGYDEFDITTVWNTASLTLQDINYPNGLRLQIIGRKRQGDGSRKKIGEYYDARLRVTYKRSIETTMRVFIEGEGREFGSWIDEGGRSNIFDEGDLIQNPAYIVESILRDEMGLSSSDIDVASFDDAWGDTTSWDHVFSVTDFIGTADLILSICTQAKMNFFFSSQNKGKVRVIDNSPSTEDDITVLDDIKRKGIKLDKGQFKSFLNKIRVAYNQWAFDGGFKDVTDAENSTSQSDYDITIEKHIKANKISKDSVAVLLRDHYSGSSGFWKDLRETLEIDMLSWEHIDWEVGDLIEPQSDLGGVLKNFNSAWGTQLMMITEKQIKKTGLSYKMMKVN